MSLVEEVAELSEGVTRILAIYEQVVAGGVITKEGENGEVSLNLSSSDRRPVLSLNMENAQAGDAFIEFKTDNVTVAKLTVDGVLHVKAVEVE